MSPPTLFLAPPPEPVMLLAQLTSTSGVNLRDIILAFIGTWIILVMAWHALSALASQEYGKLITMLLVALPVIAFAYFPDASMNVLRGLVASFWS
jgi:hypothetical protein